MRIYYTFDMQIKYICYLYIFLSNNAHYPSLATSYVHEQTIMWISSESLSTLKCLILIIWLLKVID